MKPSPAATDRTLPDGRQRSPRPAELLRSGGSVLRRVPGMALTTWRYLAHRSSVDHEIVDHAGLPGHAPDADRPLPGDDATLLRRSSGRGPLYQRTYEVVVDDARTGPEELVTRLLNDPNRASPTEVSDFEAADGGRRDPGAEFAVRMPGPWDAPVRVVERTPVSFRFATLRGHMEAGEIEFRAAWADGGRLVFTIESWARSGDRLYDWMYDKVPLAREMQLHMWVHVCEQVAQMAGGRPGRVQVTTHRWKAAARG
ncbi:MAG: hypothetical protein JWN08_2466 [Frankiales bacterium]|nr:hypothetical protein [Frankiales bacterium]